MNPVLNLADTIRRSLPDGWVLALYERPWIARVLRSVLNSAAPSDPCQVQIAGGLLQGLQLELDLKREKFLWLGTYEPWVQEAIRGCLRPADWAWDVGAYIGYHSILMWSLGARVLALEPDPVNFGRLTGNLRANGAGSVTALRLAAGQTGARARLEHVAEYPSQTSVAEANDGECTVAPLDSLLEKFPFPRLVKVDVEGKECEVLAGARRVLEEGRPVWIVEAHGTGQQVIGHFHRFGYQVRACGKSHEVVQVLQGAPSHILAIPLDR